ncbi:hypothetical protein CWE15_00400 [Aliidiomarina taiwanensis]|uniref:Uncharacterized protein n=1 Tax=Aliidiomarina taiwanensis TaxID=946228 RepID=A0A432X8I5_9GAMM|nr:hypothetical protein [Aliidiomarina taiwanensis]RUO43697.1 hypothetical protein CWE15_00400 [Aliidiomarina taiwanensis]
MNFKLADIITDANKDIASSLYIDPLGMLVIWSSYGEAIFEKRVNSISNDVRNFTVNLMHHGVVQSLISDSSFVIPEHLKNFVGDKTSSRFAQTCLLHLENIYVFSMLTAKEKNVDTSGILGSNNGRKILDAEDENPKLVFTTNREGQILVRQLGLGVSGRYRTPFLELGYFDKYYHYNHDDVSKQRWDEYRLLLAQKPILQSYFDAAVSYIKSLIKSAESSKSPLEIQFSDIPDNFKNACRVAFSTSGKVGEITRDYWLKVTGLDQGAAGILLKALRNQSGGGIEPEDVFNAAFNDENAEEREKLEHVMQVEPFLTRINLLFTLICRQNSQTMRDIESEWLKYGGTNATLADLYKNISDSAKHVLTGSARQRFEKLSGVAQCDTLQQQIAELISYHKSVMHTRGQQPWVELRNGITKLHARPLSPPDSAKELKWVNSYYLHQFNNLIRGYFGGNDHAND